uniref:Uncharacterized protein n=1 Tax=Physcomitrium patens TaxID=3218 RepID=A0A7I3Z4X6_PHYPA
MMQQARKRGVHASDLLQVTSLLMIVALLLAQDAANAVPKLPLGLLLDQISGRLAFKNAIHC